MSRRLFDFNIRDNDVKTSATTSNSTTNKAACNVYINSKDNPTVEKSQFNPNEPVYPSVNPYATRSLDAACTRDDCGADNVENNSEIDNKFYKVLALSLVEILKDNNFNLITNIFDTTGKIIVDAKSLCKFIAILCNVNDSDITLKYTDKENGCLMKVNPIKTIKYIQVLGQDMNICFNKQYNTLQNEFSISVSKVILF